jgi:hypothetical protein
LTAQRGLIRYAHDIESGNRTRRGRLLCRALPIAEELLVAGRTREEALQNIREAIDLYLEPSPQDIIEDESHEVVALSL